MNQLLDTCSLHQLSGRGITLDLPAGFILRRIRELRGYSQNQIAQNASLNLTLLSMAENGRCRISQRTALRLCKACQVEPACFFAIYEHILHAKPDVYIDD